MDSASEHTRAPVVTVHRPTRIHGPAQTGTEPRWEMVSTPTSPRVAPAESVVLRRRQTDIRNGITVRSALRGGRYAEQVPTACA